jgi:FkbM family methyltransferase
MAPRLVQNAKNPIFGSGVPHAEQSRSMKFLNNIVKSALTSWGYELRRSTPGKFLGVGADGVRTVIDCGAHTGEFAKTALAYFSKAKLYAFEPSRATFDALQTWSQGQARVTAFNYALGNRVERKNLNASAFTQASSFLPLNAKANQELFPEYDFSIKATEDVQVMTLDHLVEVGAVALEQDVFLKLDVQGFEIQVLEGAAKTLEAVQHCMIEVSFDSLYEGQPDFGAVYAHLFELGFVYRGNIFQRLGQDGHMIYADCLFSRPTLRRTEP